VAAWLDALSSFRIFTPGAANGIVPETSRLRLPVHAKTSSVCGDL
jgi:hypothetical protein